MSYSAIVTRIKTKPHPNANSLQLGICQGYQVVVSLETEDNTLGIFFPEGGQLSHLMAYNNNLYRKGRGENHNPEASGYLEGNRRVRTLKIRGEKSEGIFLSLESINWTGVSLDSLAEGTQFTELANKQICQKYINPATLEQIQKVAKTKTKIKRLDPQMFKQHFETEQLRYNVQDIPKDAHLIITEKLHGTSGRTSYCLVEQPLNSIKSTWNKYFSGLYEFKPTEKWQLISGSRRVVLDPYQSDSYYKESDFRKQIHISFKDKLQKGETVYYEIVGFQRSGNPLFSQSIPDDDIGKKLRKQYGNQMIYSYGCNNEEYKIYVYRITITNTDGISVDLDWERVKARAAELNLFTVPEFIQLFYDGNQENLLAWCNINTGGKSILDQRHIKEGVCIRIQHHRYSTILKYKSYEFCHLEGITKNSDEYIDLEEVS